MISGIGGFGSIRVINPYQDDNRVAATQQSGSIDGDTLKAAFRDIVVLRKSLEELADTLDLRATSGSNALPAAVSSAVLGINMNASPAQNQLVAPEINATPTSFTPFGPAFTGASTALATVSGVFSGTADDTLTFEINRGGTIDSGDNLRVDVFDGGGTRIDRIDIPKNTPADTAYTLSNGLRLSFSAGDLVKNDTFTVDVFASVGSVVDPDKAFNGVRNDQPNFEFGKSVTAGSFDVMGVTVDVFASDTINTVLDRINQSGAGVLAEYNAASESIHFTQQSEGTLPFRLENDTSGFLDATKLGGASDLIFTTLTSSEANTVATSYGLFGPAFTGASTSLVTVDGAYTGQTDETLTFLVKQNGTIGSNNKNIGIDVLDGTGNKIDQFNISPNSPADTPYTLSNGLTLAFSLGDLVKNDTFTVAVSASVGSVVDPDKAFNGLRNERPNFEPGKAVTAGSFAVNGVTIDVLADDTINTVLDKINSSAAGVKAVYFAASELIQMRQTTPGPVGISIDSDTSGFLDATGLLGKTAELGNYIPSDPEQDLSGVSQFSGITAGSFSINGTAISVDPDNDTLVDVIDRINQSGAGVIATLEPSLGTVSFQAADDVTPLALGDGDANFFTTLGITPGVYAPTLEKAGSRVQTHATTEALKEVSSAINALYRPSTQSLDMLNIRNDLRTILGDAFEKGGPIYRTEFGVSFDFRSQAKRIFSFTGQEQEEFRTSLRSDTTAVRDFFLEPLSGESGLIEMLTLRLEKAEAQLKQQLGSIGLFVSVFA